MFQLVTAFARVVNPYVTTKIKADFGQFKRL